MKTRFSLIVAALMVAGNASAATVNLSSAYWVQYGDAQSYSLPIAGVNLQSSPGQIQDLIVVATGAEGNPVTTNSSGMDNAYSSPNSPPAQTNPQDTFFTANILTSRGTTGTVNNNLDNTWDASLGAMKSFLKGDAMTVFFNNNQINSGGGSLQSLASWARLWITDASGSLVTMNGLNGNSGYFYLTNLGAKYDIVTQGGGGVFLGDVTTYSSSVANPFAGDKNGTDFVLSGGKICTLTISGIPTPVPCGTPGSTSTDHNLGADRAAYALIFPELNAMMNTLFGSLSASDLDKYTLHADIRLGCGFKPVIAQGNKLVYDFGANDESWGMACMYDNTYGNGLNNGYEQIFIGTATLRNQVPEPATGMLLGLSLIALMASSRRNQSRH